MGGYPPFISLRERTVWVAGDVKLLQAEESRLTHPTNFTKTTMNANQLAYEQFAIAAASKLHEQLLNDDGFFGYEGSFHCFQELFRECLYIIREEVPVEIEPVEQIIETWYQFQAEISNGERDVCYWM